MDTREQVLKRIASFKKASEEATEAPVKDKKGLVNILRYIEGLEGNAKDPSEKDRLDSIRGYILSLESRSREETKEEILKNDPITKAVDACNMILAPLKLKVNSLSAIDKKAFEATASKYRIYEDKLYTTKTVDKVCKLSVRQGVE